MQKHYIFFLAWMGISVLQAQPVLTSAEVGSIGDDINLKAYNNAGFDPGAGGAGVTWDFSDITVSAGSGSYSFVDPAKTGDGGAFPGANIAASDGLGNFTYFSLTGTSYSLYGASAGGVIVPYSDPEKLLQFPFHFMDEFTDHLHAEFTSGVDFVRDGDITVEVDGYGTLKLPSGTYTNVLRVKAVEDYQDVPDGIPLTYEYLFTEYYWYRPGTVGPLLEYFNQDVTIGGAPSNYKSLYVNDDIVLQINDQIPGAELVSVWPNPATAIVHIGGYDLTGATDYSVTDMTGKSIVPITAVPGMYGFDIDLSQLPAGIYMLELITPGGLVNRQIQKL
ncbi:MAG: T9SS type A sorting domain-containing protein [Chitinophagales bacterium]